MTEEIPFPCYPSKFLGAIAGMGPSRSLTYVVVCLRIYELRGPCPDSAEVLARRTGLPRGRVEEAVDWLVCEGKLAQTDAGLTNAFAEKILGGQESTRESKKIAGAEGASARWKKSKRNQRSDDGTCHVLPLAENRGVLDIDSSDLKKNLKTDSWPSDAFEQFWSLSPRKVSKAAALKAFEKVRKSGQVPWDRFWAGARRWASWARTRDPQYVKHPSTWINQGCWDDELIDGGGPGGGEHAQAHGSEDRFGPSQNFAGRGAAAGAARGATNGDRILAGMGRLAGRARDAFEDPGPGEGGDPVPAERSGQVVPLRARRD